MRAVPLHTFRTRYLPHKKILFRAPLFILRRPVVQSIKPYLPANTRRVYLLHPTSLTEFAWASALKTCHRLLVWHFFYTTSVAAYLESIVGKESPNKTLMPLLSSSTFHYTLSFKSHPLIIFSSLVWKDYCTLYENREPVSWIPLAESGKSNILAFDLSLLCTSLLVLYRPIPSVATPTSRCSLCGTTSHTRV